MIDSREVTEYESIRNYLEDIFLELEDIGFDIRIEGIFIRTNEYEEQTGFIVEIKRSEKFLLRDVYDYILTCETYLKERGFYIQGIEVDTPSSFKGRTETYSLDYLIGLNKSNPEKYKLELVNFRFKIRKKL